MITNNEEVETVDHFSRLFKNNYSRVKYFAYVLLKSEPGQTGIHGISYGEISFLTDRL